MAEQEKDIEIEKSEEASGTDETAEETVNFRETQEQTESEEDTQSEAEEEENGAVPPEARIPKPGRRSARPRSRRSWIRKPKATGTRSSSWRIR